MYWRKLIETVKTRQRIHYRGITGWWYDGKFLDIYWNSPGRQVTIVKETEDDVYVVDRKGGK